MSTTTFTFSNEAVAFLTTLMENVTDLSPTPVTNTVTDPQIHPIPQAEQVLEALILCVINIVAFCGNVLLWCVVVRNKSLRTASNALVLCLSSADILVSVVNMPVTIIAIIKGDRFFAKSICVLLGFANMTFFIGSVMSLAAISLNRYVLIVHPNRFKTIYTVRNTGIVIIIVWSLSMALASPPLLGWANYDYLPGQSFCFCDWEKSISYTFFMVLVCFGGPCSVMSFCYYKILCEVRSSRKRIAAAKDASSMSSENSVLSIVSNNNSNLRRENGQVNGAFIRGESLETEKKSRFSSIHEALTRQLSKRLARVEPINPSTTNPPETMKQPGVSEAGNSSPTGSLSSKQCVSGSPTLNGTPVGKRDSKYQQAASTNKAPRIRIQEACLRRTISPDSRRGSINSLIGWEKPAENEKSLGKSSPKRGPTVRKLSSSTLAVPGLKAATGSRKRRAKTASEKRRKQEELKLTKSFLVVILVFITCWFPFCITMFWGVFSPHLVPRVADMSSLLLGFFNSCCNPVIYGVMNTRFRAGYKEIFFSIFSCCQCGKTAKMRPQRGLTSVSGTPGAEYKEDFSCTA